MKDLSHEFSLAMKVGRESLLKIVIKIKSLFNDIQEMN